MSISVATNIKLDADAEIDSIIVDNPGTQSIKSIIKKIKNLSIPLTGSYSSSASDRIGIKVDREAVNIKNYEITDSGGVKIGTVTLLGENNSIKDFDSNRAGKNVIDMIHFGRINIPHISVNREEFLTKKNHVNHIASFNEFGIPKLFKSYDKINRKAIPFEDFPGKLDPVSFVESGNYIMQYMIINDLTKNIDKFIDPDDLDGAIEVFEIRNSFANTNISDIQVKGFKCSLSNENFYNQGKGASLIETKFEIKQKSNSFFEDAQDVLYANVTFNPRLGFQTSGSFAQENPVSDEDRRLSPFNESLEDKKFSFSNHFRNFIKNDYVGEITSELNIPELGTRFRSSNAGFIDSPNYVIISDDVFINAGTDSIAFISTSRS